MFFFFFFFNDTATTEIYTFPYTTLFRSAARLVALGADDVEPAQGHHPLVLRLGDAARLGQRGRDRKSTRLNSSHGYISYAVFCLKKKKNMKSTRRRSAHTHHEVLIGVEE